MQQVEYLFVAEDANGPWEKQNTSGKELVESTLNQYAKDGWRVIYFSATDLGLSFTALLERPFHAPEDFSENVS